MARLVTSDGVQVNLFLDLDSNNTGEGTLLYGPKSQPNMDFIVQGFKDFRTNTEFNNKNRLVFHCDHQITVNISSITGANYPTVSNPHVVDYETQLYYVGNDLVLSKTGTKIHRIDLFKSANTNIDNLEDSVFDGNYNSLTNKPTIPSDVNQLNDADGILDTYTKTEVDNKVSSSGGSNVEIFYASGNWTKPAGVTRLEIILVGGGGAGGAGNLTTPSGGDTIITFGSGDTVTAKGGFLGTGIYYYTGSISSPMNSDVWESIKGQAGYLGEVSTTPYGGVYTTTTSGGRGNGYDGGIPAGADGDPLGWGGGAGYRSTTVGFGNGAGPSSALLGGSGGFYNGTQKISGDGKLGGGGAYAYAVADTYAGGGGGGAGAGGGGTYYDHSLQTGGFAGEVRNFIKDVPSTSQTYSIVIGAGGDSLTNTNRIAYSMVGGGGGQGILIIKY